MTFNTVSGKAPLSYLGTSASNPANVIFGTAAPVSGVGGTGSPSTPLGTIWIDIVGNACYILVAATGSVIQNTFNPSWNQFAAGAGVIDVINGTANQITATTVGNTTTLSLPVAITTPGSLTTTTSLASGTTLTGGTGITATTGNIVASTGNITSTLGSVGAATTVTAGTTMTAGTGITATTGNIVASTGNITSTLGSVGAATTVTGGTGVTATTGNVSATAGAVNAGTSMTATAGDITATLGNVIINGAAKQLRVHGGAATDFIGSTTLVMGVSPSVANTNIAATDKVFLSRTAINASSAVGELQVTITPTTGFVVTALTPTTAMTETGDASTIDYFIVRQV